MDWNDVYFNGLTADSHGFTTPIPPWLHEVNWRYQGLWLEVPLEELLSALPNLKVHSAIIQIPRFEIIDPLLSQGELGSKIRLLEKEGFPLVALEPQVFVSCSGCTITQIISYEYALVGDFWLETGTQKRPLGKRFKLPIHMILTKPPGACYLEVGSQLIKPFTVPCYFTGDNLSLAREDPWASAWMLPERERETEARSSLTKVKSKRFGMFGYNG